jgi:hypothetical protein
MQTMTGSSHIAFKEWAVVVEALGQGEQVLILRKGGIHEQRGQFRPEHREFWLFPTQFHEDERSVIASKRPALRAIAQQANADAVAIQYFAVAESVHQLTHRDQLARLQGQHIWSEHILQQRFDFGRAPGLYVLVTRVYARPAPQIVPVLPAYGGCKSWLELDRALDTTGLTPVLDDATFQRQRDWIAELVSSHALSHA